MAQGTLAVQLFTFRAGYAADPDGTIARIAQMGFKYLEPFGHGLASQALGPRLEHVRSLKRRLDAHGIGISATHLAAPYGPHAHTVLDEVAELGTHLLIVPGPMLLEGFDLPTFKRADDIGRFCDAMNEAAALAATRGLRLGYHNHWWEFEPLADGHTPFDLMLERFDPGIFFELDTYWALTGGQDVPALLRRLDGRVLALHLKDGTGTPELSTPQVPLGDGVADYAAYIQAAPQARWHVLEMDNTAGDPFTDIEQGAQRLVAAGLSAWE